MNIFENTLLPRQWLFGLLSALTHRFTATNKRKIVLTSFHGKGYRGNTRVLFETLQNHSEFEAVWLTRNHNVLKKVRETFGQKSAEYAHSFRGIRHLGEAGAILFTHGTSDYPFLYLPRKAMRIQTYHGLPTKRGEYMRPKNNKPPNWLHRKILEYRFQPITHFVSSSDTVTEIFSARFGLPHNRFIETGYPSYDSLMNMNPGEISIHDLWPDAPPAKFLALYAPTYRKLSKTRWFPFSDQNLEKLAGFLEENNMLMAMRAHPNEGLQMEPYRALSPRFVDAGQNTIEDVNQLIACSNTIITDYSSIYIEGLLKDIPALFIPYDLDNYERGMPLPYSDVTPGPHISTQKDFIHHLKKITTGKDLYQQDRKRVREMFFSQMDGKATQRVIRHLEENLLG